MNTINDSNTNLKTFDLSVFIVPNLPYCLNPQKGHSVVGENTWWSLKCFAGEGDNCNRLGIDPQDLDITTDSMWVHVWIHGLGCDNLTDHGCGNTELYPFIKDKACGIRRDDLLPNVLPEEFLKGAVEGGTKETFVTAYEHGKKVTKAKIVWHFEQLPYRYGNHGKFEDVLKSLLTRARAFRRSESK